MKHYPKFALAACCAVAALAAAWAQNAPNRAPTPEQRARRAVETRQAVMNVQAYSIGPAAAMLRNAPFNAEVAQKAAARLKMTSGMIADVFKNDTSKADAKTRAKTDIWSDKAGFEMAVNDEVQAVDALQSAAAGGDKDATLKAVRSVTQSCGGCHDKFREKGPQG